MMTLPLNRPPRSRRCETAEIVAGPVRQFTLAATSMSRASVAAVVKRRRSLRDRSANSHWRLQDAVAQDPVARPSRPASRQSGFTMIEIALCLAIIGFALVAIIGVLPTGLNVQKDNREETIINQDAAVWMDAIRHGAQG
ncbi:MAG: type II secretion system protein, partial [Verrucomicrobiota bacterium]